ncbi:anthranilate synthase component I [Helicobacter pylori]|uniref:anthranilate synthase component I n=1 Tax=Helicobacter pylori TaxID=210 RepID=UPI001F4F5A9A|nr:anthranilate synthase component I [Helicobacter pylori]
MKNQSNTPCFLKTLEIESEATKPLLMAQVCLKRICDRNIVNIASLTPNGGAFL